MRPRESISIIVLMLTGIGSILYAVSRISERKDPCVEAVVVIADYSSMTTCTHPKHRLVPVRERTWLCKCPPYDVAEKAP